MKIYIAAAYSRQGEMRALAQYLIDHGHEITARWIDGRHSTPPPGMEPNSREHLAWAAAEDVEDVRAADVVVSVTGGGKRSRGGRHVEYGIALALGKRLIILGYPENVFHHLPQVLVLPDVDALIDELAYDRWACHLRAIAQPA